MPQERTESLGHFEMLYDCEYCETKGLLAKSQRHCPECGATQNADKRYFPKPGEEKRVDGHRYEGSDRYCPACNAPMGAAAKACSKCGSSLDGGKEVRGVVTPVAPKRPRRWWLVALVVGLIVLAIYGIWWRFIRKVEKTLTVTAHRWERSIGVEEFADVDESTWKDRVPSDARMVSCRWKERSTKQVPTGEEECHTENKDNKDGTFEQVQKCKPIYRSEPVEDEWCEFRVRRWRQLEPIVTKGNNMSPVWPTAGLPPETAGERLGAKRQSGRSATYLLEIANQACSVPEATWRKYADGAAIKVMVRAASGNVVCSSL